MSDKHIKLINGSIVSSGAMEQDIDAQIKALQTKKREQNKGLATKNLVTVVGNKNSTEADILSACYTFIGTHRLNTGKRTKKQEVSAV